MGDTPKWFFSRENPGKSDLNDGGSPILGHLHVGKAMPEKPAIWEWLESHLSMLILGDGSPLFYRQYAKCGYQPSTMDISDFMSLTI